MTSHAMTMPHPSVDKNIPEMVDLNPFTETRLYLAISDSERTKSVNMG
jgi:hypothetical protein